MIKRFEIKVRYSKIDERGREKKVTETYLVDAVSFTEAEARMIEQMNKKNAMAVDTYLIVAMKIAVFADVFVFPVGARWFACRIQYSDIDDISGTEKTFKQRKLVLADSIEHANERLTESLSGMIIPYSVVSINESPIVDIFPYFQKQE